MQPYSPGTRWTFQSRSSNFTQTEELVLLWIPANGQITDNYTRDEIAAQELWQLWAKDANTYHERYPDHFRAGEIPIIWSVTKPSLDGIFELAPHTLALRSLMPEFAGDPHEDFLSFYTHPVQDGTGEPVNWLRLPVVDRSWNAKASQKGGFVQEASGWKPSALQPTMNVVEIARAAGLWVPDLG
ncbi:hypothetical protein [Streptomyces alkaliphilus]|uniref:hypothetical protein n=1 Tax=Streptomyces alkaliphilus TaxID=1472722 RepID=UPI001E298A0D|nr:hypothetical protein [Streptomyces alkaliphilus]